MKKLKVLLINPFLFKSVFGDYNNISGRNAPLNLAYIAGVLRENNLNVKILDADVFNLSLEQTINKIKEINPNIIGLTSMTASFKHTEALAREIKKIYPKVPILIGGNHITAMPEETISLECFDVGIIGEGEYTFLELVKELSKKKPDLKNINGIVFKDKKIIKTKSRELIKDLDALPFPAWDLLPDMKMYYPQLTAYKRRPHASIITSRGCPYNCIFCDKNVFGFKYRKHSAERIVAEIEYLKENYGIREVKMQDDLFVLDKKRLEKFCDLMIKKKLNIIWYCCSRVDIVDYLLYKKMKKAGCWMVAVGIESGNQKVLDFIKKGITLEQVRNSVRLANKAGIRVKGFFMLGHPIDTEETIEDTIKFALSLKLNMVGFTITTPFPNTQLYEMVKSGDYNGLTKKYLEEKLIQAHKRFYSRISIILSFILQIRSFDDIKKYYRGFKTLLN